jgi:hypothetical protein
MGLAGVFVLLLLAIGTACGIGVVYLREVVIDELQQRVPDAERLRFPRSSWSFSELMRQHQQRAEYGRRFEPSLELPYVP